MLIKLFCMFMEVNSQAMQCKFANATASASGLASADHCGRLYTFMFTYLFKLDIHKLNVMRSTSSQ